MRGPRQVEYDAFSYVTRQLRAGAISGAQANNQLWSVMLADLSDPENALPDEVKAGLISLGIFSLKHGYRVMNGEADVTPLIDINLSVMRGLRGEGGV